MLEAEKGNVNFVINMFFLGYWEYALFYKKLDFLGGFISEDKLATTTINQLNSQHHHPAIKGYEFGFLPE